MPYICKSTKELVDGWLKMSKNLDEFVNHLVEMTDHGVEYNGIITYVIFKILRRVYGYDGARYEERSNAIKVCESALDEFKRRILFPYEDQKIARNGDVF